MEKNKENALSHIYVQCIHYSRLKVWVIFLLMDKNIEGGMMDKIILQWYDVEAGKKESNFR